MYGTILALLQAPDPVAYLNSLRTEYNTGGPKDRIRLDNNKENNPYGYR